MQLMRQDLGKVITDWYRDPYARHALVDWIRTHMPAGSPQAYADEELAVLHARRTSKQAFTPY